LILFQKSLIATFGDFKKSDLIDLEWGLEEEFGLPADKTTDGPGEIEEDKMAGELSVLLPSLLLLENSLPKAVFPLALVSLLIPSVEGHTAVIGMAVVFLPALLFQLPLMPLALLILDCGLGRMSSGVSNLFTTSFPCNLAPDLDAIVSPDNDDFTDDFGLMS